MTASTNKPGRKGKGRQYRMMRVRIDTWNKLATYTATSPAAEPCDTHTGTPLESPDYCLACDLRLDRAILKLLREDEPVIPVEDAPIKRQIAHNAGGRIRRLHTQPKGPEQLKSVMDARGAGKCVGYCKTDPPVTPDMVYARCDRCRYNVATDTEYCPCCGDRVLEQPPHKYGDAKARQAQFQAGKKEAIRSNEESAIINEAEQKSEARGKHSGRREKRWK